MTDRVWILGSADPEMEQIERLLRESGERVAYAVDARGERVHAGSAYRATGAVDEAGAVVDLAGEQVYLVECAVAGVDGVVIDHHRPGDPGYGRPPAEFLAASSIGQVWRILRKCAHPRMGFFAYDREWILSDGGETRDVGGFLIGPPYAEAVPLEVVLVAAADHCLAAAYRGDCPGVDPDALMRWRAATRAQFQGRHVDDVLADVERAKEALLAAPEVVLKQTTMCPWHALGHSPEQDCQNEDGTDYADACCRYVVARDMRTCPRCDGRGGATGASEADGYDPCGPCHAGPRGPVPELVEAATRLDVGYISGPLVQPDGRRKITCSGSAELVRAFMSEWAPSEGLTGIYGDPARGFAGGYLE